MWSWRRRFRAGLVRDLRLDRDVALGRNTSASGEIEAVAMLLALLQATAPAALNFLDAREEER